MKNLPENEFWNAIKARLEKYEEDPADDWDRIAGAISSGNRGVTNLNQSSDIIASLILAFILGFQIATLQVDDLDIHPQLSLQAVLSDKASANKPTQEKQPDAIVEKESKTEERQSPRTSSERTILLNNSHKNISPQKTINNRARPKKVSLASGTDPVNIERPAIVEAGIIAPATSIATDPSDIVKDTLAMPLVLKSDTSAVSSPVIAEKQKKRKKFRPSVYLQMTPSMAYQKIIPARNDAVTIQKLNSPGVISPERFGWSAELGFQMEVSPKLELYTSLSYYQQQQTISYTYTSADNPDISQLPDSWSYTLSPGSATREFGYDMRNAGLSAGVLYFLKGRKLMHKIGGGILYQKGFLSRNEGHSYVNSKSDYAGYQLMYRLEYVFNRRTNLFVQPVFTHSLWSNEKLGEPFTIKPYRAGVGLGIVYHF